jgi:hypothetical protein
MCEFEEHSLKESIDRLEAITEQQARQISQIRELFIKMQQEFWRKVIEFEVNKHSNKDKQGR